MNTEGQHWLLSKNFRQEVFTLLYKVMVEWWNYNASTVFMCSFESYAGIGLLNKYFSYPIPSSVCCNFMSLLRNQPTSIWPIVSYITRNRHYIFIRETRVILEISLYIVLRSFTVEPLNYKKSGYWFWD